MKINIASKEKIHFIGIGGIGMSGLAQIMNNMGFTIQGSDQSANKNTDRLIKSGIKVYFGHNYKNVDKVIVVQSTQELQIQRVVNREGNSSISVKNRLKSQMPLEEKLNYADYVLDNTSGRDLLKSQVHRLYTEFKSLT